MMRVLIEKESAFFKLERMKMMSVYIICPKCEGRGKQWKYWIWRTDCSECRGEGKIQLDRKIDHYAPHPKK